MTMRPLLPLFAALATASCVGGIRDGDDSVSPPTPDQAGGPTKRGPGPGTGPATGTDPGPITTAPKEQLPPPPFEALPPRAYAAKVKDILTGLALTDDELVKVTADPRALRALIDVWMTTDQFKEKSFEFFKTAFQQTQIGATELDDQLGITQGGIPNVEQRKMLRAVEEMFARTVMDIVAEGRPFTDVLTTTKFRMNPPLMAALAYMDAAPKDDLERALPAGSWVLQKFGPTFRYLQATNVDPATGIQTPISWEESTNPLSPNFMKFTFRQPPMRADVVYVPCKDELEAKGASAIRNVWRAMFGARPSCQGAPAEPPVFTDADWNDWRVVTVRAPRAGEERTVFWDTAKLRNPETAELVVATPRVGFFTTLAFFANWPTNPSNQYRVTTNQALIVALGRSFDDRATTVQLMETSVDAQHVEPNSPCFGCHQMLDPMRDFFKQSYSLTYFQQLSNLDPKAPALPAEGVFTLDGSPAVRGQGVAAFARAMAQHPAFAASWTQKLCQLANAEVCNEQDPEFLRVANAWKASKFEYRTLVRELFSSPLVTFAEKTKTAEQYGVVMAIARREQLCARLSSRLGAKDVCNKIGTTGLPRIAGKMKNLSLGVPGSGYARADELPVTPHDPNLFFASGTEKMCVELAGQLVENPMTGRWKVATKEQAFADFVSVLMGIPPSDPRSAAMVGILSRHYTAAAAKERSTADSLRSTFTLACSSPIAVSIGL